MALFRRGEVSRRALPELLNSARLALTVDNSFHNIKDASICVSERTAPDMTRAMTRTNRPEGHWAELITIDAEVVWRTFRTYGARPVAK